MGQPDFRVGGRIFATLAAADRGYGNVKLAPEQQEALIRELPDVFLPVAGGWGRLGMTHVRLSAASEKQLTLALGMAWELRVERNAESRKRARISRFQRRRSP